MVAVAKPQTQPLKFVEIVDGFVELNTQMKAVDKLIKERDELRKRLAEHTNTVSDGVVKLTGYRYYISFSKARIMRTINNIPAFLEAVGLEAFLTAVKINTTAADKLLSPNQKATLFEVSPGVRRVKDTGQLSGIMQPCNP